MCKKGQYFAQRHKSRSWLGSVSNIAERNKYMKSQKILYAVAAMLFCVSVLMMPWNAIEMKSNKSGTQLILLPPLCFVREMYESEEQMEALEESRQIHSQENADQQTQLQDDASQEAPVEQEVNQTQQEQEKPEVQVKVKFKIVEWIKSLFQ